MQLFNHFLAWKLSDFSFCGFIPQREEAGKRRFGELGKDVPKDEAVSRMKIKILTASAGQN